MTNSDVQVFACDVCGSDDPAEIEVARLYTGNRPFHVCKACGLVYARERRSEQAVADTWSNELFQDTVDLRSYTAAIPWMIGRLTVVAEFLHQNIGLRGKVVAEIGAGEGVFPTIIRREPYGAEVFGIEPSSRNCKILRDLGIPTFEGTIGAYIESPEAATRQFDVVAMLWTLEASQSPRRMVEAARKMLKPGGYVVVGTGSRILVPFKKPLHMYLVEGPVDVHPVNFSFNTLRGLLASTGFEMTHVNSYIDNDLLIMMGRKQENVDRESWPRDDWKAVIAFFDRWHKETQDHYADR